ncbi:natterin-4-like isoform X1 [Trachinotus anak]|uniref:natterin-4-like isoform X1 n=2 Tax=Trachinotus anak TaxID=443729 RepID=UPI0039F1C6A2
MMKPLLSSLLLALSLTSCQDTVKSSQHRNVSLLNPNLDDRVPEVMADTSMLKHQLPSPPKLRQKRQGPPPSSAFNIIGKLKWKPWGGSIPTEAVSIDNTYVGRKDYVCKYRCHAGFHNPDLGSYCHYSYGGEVNKDPSFEILVNEDNFEILEWKDGSYGSVPQHSVWTCSTKEIYVGKNKYGLGKVQPEQQNFFLLWKGSEYSYNSYQVLTVREDVKTEHISNVEYNNKEAKLFQNSSESMHFSTMNNLECNAALKTANFSKAYQMVRKWHINSPVLTGAQRKISAGIPAITLKVGTAGVPANLPRNLNIEIGPQVASEYSGATTDTQAFTHSTSVEFTIPPNHHCTIYMVEYKHKVIIPFTARLERTYSNGETTSTTISGTYENIWTGEIQAVVDRCVPTADARPCPKKPDP